jgi:hypothetical protein
MASFRSRMGARLRRALTVRRIEPPAAAAPAAPAPAAAIRAGLGEPPAAPDAAEAPEAELDTLRGELVRELDRIAADEPGSASFRRIAS